MGIMANLTRRAREWLSSTIGKLWRQPRRLDVNLTGLLLGAGASYDVGMPLAMELTKELKDWLTPDKLRSLNRTWQEQGAGYSKETIEDVAQVLAMDTMNYEAIMGYLEVQSDRLHQRSQEYHGLRAFLSEIVYFLLKEMHVRNEALIVRNTRFLDGIKTLINLNRPLWAFSLNHDLVVECFVANAGIPVKYGFSEDVVRLPRRDVGGVKIGDLKAQVTRRQQFEKQELNFFPPGEYGLNLLKIHGSLDEFAFNDGHDLLKLMPDSRDSSGVFSALRNANDEVRYIDPRWPGGAVHARNEIAYADDLGEMQFLRRTPLAGAFKFQNQSNQTVPNELLGHFELRLTYLSGLICLGYSFGDQHVNQAIRHWLEGNRERQLTIVDPAADHVPSGLLHLSPQIQLVKSSATDFLDLKAGISRERGEKIERQIAILMRNRGSQEVNEMIREYMDKRIEDTAQRMASWAKTLPWRDGSIDLEEMDISMDEFLQVAMEKVPMPSREDALEDFLKQATHAQ